MTDFIITDNPNADLSGLATTAERLSGEILEEALQRDGSIYRGRGGVIALDGSPHIVPLEMQVDGLELLVAANGMTSVIHQLSGEEADAIAKAEIVHLQYTACPRGIRLVGLSSESRKRERPNKPEEVIPRPVEVPPPIPATMEMLQVPNIPDRKLLEKVTELYLAQAVQLRLREYYDPEEKKIKIPNAESLTSRNSDYFAAEEILSYLETKIVLGLKVGTSALQQWKVNEHPLIRRTKARGGIAVEDVLAVYLCDLSNKKRFTNEEIAEFFDVSTEIITELQEGRKYFESKARHGKQATTIRQRFREAYNLALDTLLAGKSLFEERTLKSLLAERDYLDTTGIMEMLTGAEIETETAYAQVPQFPNAILDMVHRDDVQAYIDTSRE